MTEHEHARPDQLLTAGLMAVLTASYLAFLGWCVWRDVQSRRETKAFQARVHAHLQQAHREPDYEDRQLEAYR